MLLLPALELALEELAGFPARCPVGDVLVRVGFEVVDQRRVGASMMNQAIAAAGDRSLGLVPFTRRANTANPGPNRRVVELGELEAVE